jgi:hypothetical protein
MTSDDGLLLHLSAEPTVDRILDSCRVPTSGRYMNVTGANLDGHSCTITSVFGADEDDSDPVDIVIELATPGAMRLRIGSGVGVLRKPKLQNCYGTTYFWANFEGAHPNT